MKKVTVMYSCTECGLKRVTLLVDGPGLGSRNKWLAEVSLFISRDHHTWSPDCVNTRLSNVFIPMSEACA